MNVDNDLSKQAQKTLTDRSILFYDNGWDYFEVTMSRKYVKIRNKNKNCENNSLQNNSIANTIRDVNLSRHGIHKYHAIMQKIRK